MYMIQSSYCEAFKNEKELNEAISKYVELRKKDRFDAIKFIDSYRNQMNTEGKRDLQEVLENAFLNDYSYGEKEIVEVVKTKEQAFIEENISQYGYEAVYAAVLARHDGDRSKADVTMREPTIKTEKWFKSITETLNNSK
jgi:hypothetical protein